MILMLYKFLKLAKRFIETPYSAKYIFDLLYIFEFCL